MLLSRASNHRLFVSRNCFDVITLCDEGSAVRAGNGGTLFIEVLIEGHCSHLDDGGMADDARKLFSNPLVAGRAAQEASFAVKENAVKKARSPDTRCSRAWTKRGWVGCLSPLASRG